MPARFNIRKASDINWQQEAELDRLLAGREALTITYERLLADPDATVRAVAAHLGPGDQAGDGQLKAPGRARADSHAADGERLPCHRDTPSPVTSGAGLATRTSR